MMKKTHAGKLVLTSIMLISGIGLASCGNTSSTNNSTSSQTSVGGDSTSSTSENIKVSEISLTLSASKARIGETVTATVKFQPTNATNKEYVLSSSDETIAKIENNAVVCVARGNVTITARSSQNALKKAEATLTVLGNDEQGRTENIFEAEEGNLVKTTDSTMAIEHNDDDRISGGAVVGSIKKGDRIIWGVTSSAADDNASMTMRLMGPSGWGGLWNSISYTFADWFTVKVNGHTINTENVKVEGTYNNLSSADYYNFTDVTIGDVDLIAGLNVVTFVVSNRFDVTSVSDDKYNGSISCLGNIDSMTIYSTKDLTYVADTAEVDGADPDVSYKSTKLEAEASTTRVYESSSNPQVDLGSSTYAQFKTGMNVMFGVKTAAAMKTKLVLKVAAPYVDAATAMTDTDLSSILSINIGGKNVSIDGLKLLGNNATGNKENYTLVTTGWVDLEAGDNIIDVVVNDDITGFAYLGGLDYLELDYIDGTITPFLNEEPSPKKDFTFQAEAATTKRVGYDALAEGATYVELKEPTKTQTDKYNNKLDTTKIIFGIESSTEAYATISMKMAAPYINKTTAMTDVSVGSLGDLWFNGDMISTPNKLLGNDKTGVKDNFTTVTIESQVKLTAGKNRIAWEPQNYTENTYTYFGAMDSITVTTASTLTAYEVNMWTDRNTYFDSTKNEPIYVTCDSVASTSCWIGLWHTNDSVTKDCPGSLYWYYPTNSQWNSDNKEYLGTACDITKQNPNKERHLIDGLDKGSGTYTNNDANGYGEFQVVYMENDSKNSTTGYDITDVVYISVWNEPSNYGGYVGAQLT